MIKRLLLTADVPGLRLDLFVSQGAEVTRALAQRLIRDGLVTVNGERTKAGLRLQGEEKIEVTIPPTEPASPAPEAIPLDIVYEDDDLMVVDKPPGLTVHPAPGHPNHTLVNAVLAHHPTLAQLDSSPRPGIVHRLDKDTSGLIMVAKNPTAQARLSHQLKTGSVVKRYLVLVRGKLSPQRGAIEAPLGRHPRNRKRMAVVDGGRAARTLYQVIRYAGNFSLLEVTLETGRTHQIRVHLSAIGYPVVGDATYGIRSPHLDRQFVHACYLKLRLPGTGEEVEFTSPLPQDLSRALDLLSGPFLTPSLTAGPSFDMLEDSEESPE
ncbi:MAG: RluA family pseudouridine synthase [Dehalococcoidia bacterium]